MVERVGISVMLGLQKADPFPKDKCDFGDPKCIVGPGCSTPGVCYHLSCGECEPVDQGDQGEPRRHQYIGQTGTSLHRRMLGHLAKGDTVINKHKEEYHLQRNQENTFNMKILKVHQLLMERLVSEGILIANRDKSSPGTMMNGRG